MKTSTAVAYTEELPVGSMGHQALGWHGMIWLIATEAALFGYLLFSYYYLAAHGHTPWLTEELPKLRLALPNTVLLVASSFVVWWGGRGIKQGQRWRLLLGLGLTFVMGCVFIAVQGLEWQNKTLSLSDGAYGSLYFTTTGFHLAHVLIGVIILLLLFIWSALGYFNQRRHAAVSIGAAYWHFVDVVWLTVFTTYYLLPYLR